MASHLPSSFIQHGPRSLNSQRSETWVVFRAWPHPARPSPASFCCLSVPCSGHCGHLQIGHPHVHAHLCAFAHALSLPQFPSTPKEKNSYLLLKPNSNDFLKKKKKHWRDFPGGPVVKASGFLCRRRGDSPWSLKTSHARAARSSQGKKKKKASDKGSKQDSALFRG